MYIPAAVVEMTWLQRYGRIHTHTHLHNCGLFGCHTCNIDLCILMNKPSRKQNSITMQCILQRTDWSRSKQSNQIARTYVYVNSSLSWKNKQTPFFSMLQIPEACRFDADTFEMSTALAKCSSSRLSDSCSLALPSGVERMACTRRYLHSSV